MAYHETVLDELNALRAERQMMKTEIERLKLAKAQQTAQADMRSAENVKLRSLAKRLANAVVTGQRHEGLICQAEDFLRNEQ